MYACPTSKWNRVATIKTKTSLLGVVTQTYLRFSQLNTHPQQQNQHLHFGANFPKDVAAEIYDSVNEPTTHLNTKVLQNLDEQSIQPSWCLIRIAQGYVFVMQSTTEQRTLLEWITTSVGNLLKPEAQQQDRFIEVRQLFVGP